MHGSTHVKRDREWRCSRCGKLLGMLEGQRLHISFARGHEYFVGFPVTTLCRACGALNELGEPRRAALAKETRFPTSPQ
ncbi:hypothetical protein RAS1_41900 [Phycisphaerae bacterium RAS1]|nr:hypothetical protein RAS1_41900 [Phycisphaerae bacterium RAS1]